MNDIHGQPSPTHPHEGTTSPMHLHEDRHGGPEIQDIQPPAPSPTQVDEDRCTMSVAEAVHVLENEFQVVRSDNTIQRWCREGSLKNDYVKRQVGISEMIFIDPDALREVGAAIQHNEAMAAQASQDTDHRQPDAPSPVQGNEELGGGALHQAPSSDAANADHLHEGGLGSDENMAEGPEKRGDNDDRLLHQIERENDFLRSQIEIKDSQITSMNNQLDDLIERGREDKVLIQNFQRHFGMLPPGEEQRRQRSDFEETDEPRRLYVHNPSDERSGDAL